jgi:ribosomal protein L35
LVDLYTEVNRGGLDNDRLRREWTAEFAKQAAVGDGLVADLGCKNKRQLRPNAILPKCEVAAVARMLPFA